MKSYIYSLLVLSLLCGACDKNKRPSEVMPVVDAQLQEATNEMSRLIDEGSHFDIEQISWNDYWYVDAKMKYNEDFSMVTEVVSPIGGAWQQEQDPVMRINDGVLVRYELSDSGDVVDVQHGVFEFYKRISTLYIDLDAQDDYEAILIEAQLLAYTDDSFIIEWKSDDECYRALFKRLDLSVLERKGAEIKLGAMLAEAGELNADTVAELIVGSWVGDTRLEYDSNEYASISHVDAICAVYYSTPYPPGFGGQYIFNPDGTLINIVEVEYPPFEEVTYTYTWCYDVDTNRMTIVDSSNNSRDYTIIALSDKWLFVDYELEECDTQTGEVVTKYLRDGYRRITE